MPAVGDRGVSPDVVSVVALPLRNSWPLSRRGPTAKHPGEVAGASTKVSPSGLCTAQDDAKIATAIDGSNTAAFMASLYFTTSVVTCTTGPQSTMPADLQPTLVGELLSLRPLRHEDFDDLFAVASDPLIWEQHPDSDRYTPEVFREFFRIAMESKGALIAIDSTTGKVIGSSRYHGYDAVGLEVEIGWTFLARSHWGGVYNGEMKKLMIEHRLWLRKTGSVHHR